MSDITAVPALLRHLEAEGFPAMPCGDGELEVLFPARASAFPAAAELDLWLAANDGVTVAVAHAEP